MKWWQKILQALITAGIIAEDKKAEAEKAFEQLEDPTPVPAPKPTPEPAKGADGDEIDKRIAAALSPMQATLDTMSGLLQKQAEATDAAQARLKQEMEASTKKDIDETLAAATKEGKIPTDEKEQTKWRSRLEKDLAGTKEILAEIVPPAGAPRPKPAGDGAAKTPSGEPQFADKLARGVPKEFLKHVQESVESA